MIWKAGDICLWHGERVSVIGTSINRDYVEVINNKDEEFILKTKEVSFLPLSRRFFLDSNLKEETSNIYTNYSIIWKLKIIQAGSKDNQKVWNVFFNDTLIASIKYAHELKRIVDALNIPLN